MAILDVAQRALTGRKTFADFQREEEEFNARRKQRMLQEQMAPLKLEQAQLGLEKTRRSMEAPEMPFQGTSFDAQIANEAYRFNRSKGMSDAEARQGAVDMVLGSKTDYSQVTDPYTGQTSLVPRPRQGIFGEQEMAQAAPQPQADPLTANREAAAARAVEIGQPDLPNARDAEQPGIPEDEFQGLLARIGVTDPRAARAPDVQMSGTKDVQQFLLSEEEAERDLERAIRLEEEKASLTQEAAERKRQTTQQMADAASRVYNEAGIQDIDDALRILKDNPWAAGTLAGAGKFIKESPAGQLQSNLVTVQGGVGFGRLDQMRRASPTGASGLGALSKPEMDLLQASLGEIKVTTDPRILARNLMRYRNILMDTIHGTPEQIQGLIDEGKVDPEVAKPLMQRYNLQGMAAPLSQTEQKRLEELRAKYGRQ